MVINPARFSKELPEEPEEIPESFQLSKGNRKKFLN
jgi:hypothetical protein